MGLSLLLSPSPPLLPESDRGYEWDQWGPEFALPFFHHRAFVEQRAPSPPHPQEGLGEGFGARSQGFQIGARAQALSRAQDPLLPNHPGIQSRFGHLFETSSTRTGVSRVWAFEEGICDCLLRKVGNNERALVSSDVCRQSS